MEKNQKVYTDAQGFKSYVKNGIKIVIK